MALISSTYRKSQYRDHGDNGNQGVSSVTQSYFFFCKHTLALCLHHSLDLFTTDILTCQNRENPGKTNNINIKLCSFKKRPTTPYCCGAACDSHILWSSTSGESCTGCHSENLWPQSPVQCQNSNKTDRGRKADCSKKKWLCVWELFIFTVKKI